MMAIAKGICSILLVLNIVTAQNGCNTAVQLKCKKNSLILKASVCLTTKCPAATTGSAAFQQRMVDGHNEYRLKAFTNGSFGGDMLKMTWDNELATGALNWAHDLCKRDSFEHDTYACRATASYNSVGQNLMCGSGSIYADEVKAADEALRMWFEEIEMESAEQMFPFKWNPAAGHYTAMVWSRSFKVGCGFVKIPNARYKIKIWIACNYAPGGNVLGLNYNVFEPSSAPATNCMPGSAKGDSGLCEVTDEALLRQHVKLSNVK